MTFSLPQELDKLEFVEIDLTGLDCNIQTDGIDEFDELDGYVYINGEKYYLESDCKSFRINKEDQESNYSHKDDMIEHLLLKLNITIPESIYISFSAGDAYRINLTTRTVEEFIPRESVETKAKAAGVRLIKNTSDEDETPRAILDDNLWKNGKRIFPIK